MILALGEGDLKMDIYSTERLAIKNYIEHHGVKGQKWGVRRYQNKDGSLTKEGKNRSRIRSRIRSVYKTKDDVNMIVDSLTNNQKHFFGYSPEEIKRADKFLKDIRQFENISKTFIAYDKSGKAASFLQIWDNDPSFSKNKVGEIAIATRKDLQGKGYSDIVTKKALNWFESDKNKEIGELQWNVFENNGASVAIAKKYGFKEQDRLHWDEYPGEDYIFNSKFKKLS